MDNQQLKYIVEAALLAAGRPLDLNGLQSLFGDDHPPGKDELRAAIVSLQEDYASRGIAIDEVASGFRIQIRSSMSGWLARLWEERAPRYSRALMETLAIIAYRQPVTRGDVEDIRGVGVTTNIMRSLLERSWIRVVGFRDVPGKPAIYGTTREFLDYFGLKKLDDLPPLADLKDLEAFTAQLELTDAESLPPGAGAPLLVRLDPDADDSDGDESDGELATVTRISAARNYVDASGDVPSPESGSNVVPLKIR
ncbi:MAG: SMC-Scp complex subunit ScpB [Gammaproteobacteria bacterium]|nr:SMC-Scp complex subunit ScpB [Gammaproteobacteria bacterium]